jgi:hypothetical protein
MKASTVSRTPSLACPSFFRALCGESYSSAGRELTRHVASLIDLEGDELATAMAELDAAINPRANGRLQQPNESAVLAWFDGMLPNCMANVPPDRRGSFLAGVLRFTREEGNDVTSY